jgi:hypothetical protein
MIARATWEPPTLGLDNRRGPRPTPGECNLATLIARGQPW